MFKFPNFKLLTHLLVDCYKNNKTHSEVIAIPIEDTVENCPRSFDGFACWNKAPGGANEFQNCPEYIVGFDPKRLSFKQCLRDGTWYKNQPNATLPWINYTACVDIDDLNFMNIVNVIYIIGYSISTMALIFSILIFSCFRTVHCIRNTIHIHLFTAFIFNNIFWIIWYATVVNDATVLMENKWWCQILHVLNYYFMVTGYAWMFCEGLHLFLNLTVVFVSEEFLMRLFKLIGWVVPAFIVAGYAIRRQFTPNGTERCWIEDSDAMWIISIPILASLFFSTVFLVHIIRVLVKKANPGQIESGLTTVLKAARATLILVPLFGLHFFLIPFQPSGESTVERAYHVFSAILISFQGLCIAVLFCFTNPDVVTALKTFVSRARIAHDGGLEMGITGGDSTQNTRESVL